MEQGSRSIGSQNAHTMVTCARDNGFKNAGTTNGKSNIVCACHNTLPDAGLDFGKAPGPPPDACSSEMASAGFNTWSTLCIRPG